jgi:phosphate/sulfate permease
MNPTLIAIRSIAAEFARRIYLPVVITLAIIAAIIVALLVWALTLSAWWWLVALPVFFFMVIIAVVIVVIGIIIRFFAPDMTKAQKQKVASFVDKMQGVSEVTQTPKFVLLFRIIRDARHPSKRGYIQSTIKEVTSLKGDFSSLVDSF